MSNNIFCIKQTCESLQSIYRQLNVFLQTYLYMYIYIGTYFNLKALYCCVFVDMVLKINFGKPVDKPISILHWMAGGL